MRVLMITPEATPFAQTGGLGEVIQALPAELCGLGVDVDVLMPKYRGISEDKFNIHKLGLEIVVTLNAKQIKAGLWKHETPSGAKYFFIDCPEYFDRDYLYGSPEADYEDNAERFVFLTRAAIEVSLATNTHYDVFHSHDWQAALTPVYLRTLYAGEPSLQESAAIMTIHNLGYQGIFWHLDMPLVGVGWEFFTPSHMEFHGKLNFLKSGIVFADEVNTVSKGYRNEILTPEFGFGLEGVLQEKGDRLSGILNGVDYSIWNPETDTLIDTNYSPENLSGKSNCKADLQKLASLPERPTTPLIGMVSRLSSQKGVDLLLEIISSIVRQDVQLVILGTGDSHLQKVFSELNQAHSEKIATFLSYDYLMAHKIFAGSDVLLVPSRYEPCGLNQLYAMKYGAVPVVRSTGGLMDTVDEFDAANDSGNGFRFLTPSSVELEDSINRALNLYNSDPNTWRRLMIRGMKKDYSWHRSAREYLKLYEKALQDRRDYLSK